jgi:hypothetical protein
LLDTFTASQQKAQQINHQTIEKLKKISAETMKPLDEWLEESLKGWMEQTVSFQFLEHPAHRQEVGDDLVAHSRLLLSFGLLYLVFRKATREGNGAMVVPIWKALTAYFFFAGKRKYW